MIKYGHALALFDGSCLLGSIFLAKILLNNPDYTSWQVTVSNLLSSKDQVLNNKLAILYQIVFISELVIILSNTATVNSIVT